MHARFRLRWREAMLFATSRIEMERDVVAGWPGLTGEFWPGPPVLFLEVTAVQCASGFALISAAPSLATSIPATSPAVAQQ